jgi:hypothetical protein
LTHARLLRAVATIRESHGTLSLRAQTADGAPPEKNKKIK